MLIQQYNEIKSMLNTKNISVNLFVMMIHTVHILFFNIMCVTKYSLRWQYLTHPRSLPSRECCRVCCGQWQWPPGWRGRCNVLRLVVPGVITGQARPLVSPLNHRGLGQVEGELHGPARQLLLEVHVWLRKWCVGVGLPVVLSAVTWQETRF